MMNKKEYEDKKKYYETQLNNEVEKLKILLETTNILYINLNSIVERINNYKIVLEALERNKEIDYLYNDEWE